MDGDDICARQRLERQLEYMTSHPDCDFLATGTRVMSETGKYIRKAGGNFKGRDVRSYLVESGNPFVHSSMMMRKRALDELGGYNEDWRTRQDYELWLRAAFAGKKFACLDDCLHYFRFHKTSLSVAGRDNLLANLLLRGYYRAKDKGKDIDLKKLRKKLQNSEVMRTYTEYIVARRRAKYLLSDVRALDLKRCWGDACELLKPIVFRRKSFTQERINTALDDLCGLCEVKRNQ